MDLATFSLADTDPGDDVLLADGTRGSALDDANKLGRCAVAVKFNIGATGDFAFVNRAGRTRVIDVATYATGAWHLMQIVQCLATGSTVADTDFELGWSNV